MFVRKNKSFLTEKGNFEIMPVIGRIELRFRAPTAPRVSLEVIRRLHYFNNTVYIVATLSHKPYLKVDISFRFTLSDSVSRTLYYFLIILA